jgi:DNA-directed RNA polymerase specialized sigma24 family protein
MDVRLVAVPELARLCHDETTKYLRREPSRDDFCLELLRRAIVDGDQAAWGAILTQYRGMVLSWLRKGYGTAMGDEDDDHWVNRTFERFWQAVGPQRFADFPSLANLLQYLKQCAITALLDDARQRARERLDERASAAALPAADPEPVALGRLAQRDLWALVIAETQDDAERLVAHESFVLTLKPGEIQERHPDHFATTADVYRVKRNLLDRLRRSTALREWRG